MCFFISDAKLEHKICTNLKKGCPWFHSYSFLLFSIGVDNDVYGDFAKLLASSSNVESADIPSGMQVRELTTGIVSQMCAKLINFFCFFHSA